MDLHTKEEETPNLENKLTVARREGSGQEIVMEFGMDVCTLLYLKWITNKALLYSTWHPGWEGITCVCMAESFYCSPETVPALLIGYTPIQNKVKKIKKIKS